jgi:hypothetical protein
LVSPGIYSGLQRADVLDATPPDVAEYFEAMHLLNEERNRRVLFQIREAVAALQSRGIEPVLLKSAAHLPSGAYRALGDRFIRDIDLLVSPDAIDATSECLHRLGYSPLGEPFEVAPDFRHLPTLIRGDDEVAIEIHRRIADEAAAPLLTAAEVLRDAEVLKSDGLCARIPSLAHRMIHHVCHAQIQDFARPSGSISLRRLVDVGALGEWLSQRGQWPKVFEAFDRRGLGSVVREYLYAAHRLFGAEVPLADVSTLRARLAWRRYRIQRRWPALARVNMAAHCAKRVLAQMRRDAACRRRWSRRLLDFRFYRRELSQKISANFQSQL